MGNSPERKGQKSIWVKPVLISAVVAVLILALTLAAEEVLWKYAVDESAGDHMASLDRDSFLIEARIRGRANDMFFLKRVAEDELARNPNGPPISENLRSATRTMMLARSQYDQIHLLDLSGREVFRYNWDRVRQTIEDVPPSALQDKSDRPYYRETLNSPANAAVFSPLDLNVEHGQVEQPPKPTMRVSGQIVGPDGKPRTLLVLNYMGDQLLRELKQDTTQPRQSMLLNGDGYWIVGPDAESEWGFMYPEKKGNNLKEQQPALWKKINAAKAGWFDDGATLYSFENIDPVGSPTDYPPLRMPVKGGERLRWTLLVATPNALVWQKVSAIRRIIWTSCGAVLIIVVPLVALGVANLQRRRRDLRTVREARNMLDSVIATSPHGILVMEAVRDVAGNLEDLRLILSNRTAAELLSENLTLNQEQGLTMLQAHPEARSDGTFENFRRVVDKDQPIMFEQLYLQGDYRRWLSIRGAKREDGLVVTLVDITERKDSEEKLRQNEMLLRMTGKMSKVGGWMVDYPSRKVRWTEELFEIHEVPLDFQPSINEGLDFYAPECREIVRQGFEACVRDGTPFDLEVELITGKSNRIWVRAMGQVEMKDGRLQRVVGTMQDITAAKNTILELRESQMRLINSLAQEQELTRRAQAAERAKSEFLAVMSHELRTPMNGVIGMTSILSDTELSETQRDCVNTIQASGEALVTVINDILDFSKIESGGLILETRPFNLRQCVEETVDLFAPQIREKRIEAAYLIAPNVPASLSGDSARLRQILTNLIGNAVKFTEKGEIVVSIECRSSDARGFHLLFSVADTGIGISPEGIKKLFQSFQQVDSSMTRRYGGTGLGLVISKRLAELMDGTMWVESEPGAGSTFYFSAILPAAATQGAVKASESAVLKPCAVLIVDDNATNRRILDTQLKAWGLNPVSVSSGKDALHKIASTPFDVVLLDLQMPDMDGISVAREIRRTAQMPLILLSSAGKVEGGEAANLFQFQIPKPIRQSLLFEALRQVTAGGAATAPRKTVLRQFDSGMAERRPLRILIAEDNPINQKVNLMMLGSLGYRADIAENGLRVLEAVDKATYDLIFMDIQMPEMDGVEATGKLREKMGTRCPFIVALTANSLEGDREKFLDLGFDAYLSKPLSAAALQTMLREMPIIA